MLFQCRASVADAGSTLKQHRVNFPSLLGMELIKEIYTLQLLLYKTAAALLALAYNYVQLLIRTAAILCYDNLATTY